jgi:hypothetical protein
MKQLLYSGVLLSMLVCGPSAWANFYTESLIYTGPPEFEEMYEYSETGPTYVSASAFGKDAEAHAEYWSVGGRLTNSWDNTYQGWIYIFSDIEKVFEVTAPGPAAITFSWTGALEVVGDPAYDGAYNLYASASLEDYTLPANDDVYWYHDLESPGTLPVSESTTFTYDFTAGDVGSLFSVGLVFDSMVSLNVGSISMDPSDSLEFSSSFYDSLKIEGISGGIQAIDNGPNVPEPSTLGLLCSALIAAVGVRKTRS